MFEEFCAKKRAGKYRLSNFIRFLFVTLKLSDYLALIARAAHEAFRAILIECASDTVMWTD